MSTHLLEGIGVIATFLLVICRCHALAGRLWRNCYLPACNLPPDLKCEFLPGVVGVQPKDEVTQRCRRTAHHYCSSKLRMNLLLQNVTALGRATELRARAASFVVSVRCDWASTRLGKKSAIFQSFDLVWLAQKPETRRGHRFRSLQVWGM